MADDFHISINPPIPSKGQLANSALGDGLRNAHGLEMVADAMLAEALGVSLRLASLLAGTVGLGRTLSMLRTLAGEPECRIPEELLMPWVKSAETARDVRNRLIHRPYMTKDGGFVVGKGYTIQTKTLADIRADTAVIVAAAEAGAELLDRLLKRPGGGPRRKPGEA